MSAQGYWKPLRRPWPGQVIGFVSRLSFGNGEPCVLETAEVLEYHKNKLSYRVVTTTPHNTPGKEERRTWRPWDTSILEWIPSYHAHDSVD